MKSTQFEFPQRPALKKQKKKTYCSEDAFVHAVANAIHMTQTLKNPTHQLARVTADNTAHFRSTSSYENNQPHRGRVTALDKAEHNDHMEARAAARGSPLDTGLYFDTKEVRADTVKSRNQSPGHTRNVISALTAQRVFFVFLVQLPS